MNKKFLATLVIVLLVVLVFALPASAITDGEPDGDGHPYVGLLIFDIDGYPSWRCSGTLISPTIVLTAGHCTDGANGGNLWIQSDLEPNPSDYGYPWGGPDSYEIASVHTLPGYNTLGPWIMYDAGIVILAEPVYLAEYGVLPEVDQFDLLQTKRGKQNTTFTAVGYGLQQSFPDAVSWKDSYYKTRMVANPRLIQLNVPGFTGDFSFLLSNNAHTGGTCYGDSGGPNFVYGTNIVAGITSFGINGNCAGTGGVFRMDRANVLDWVSSFLP